MHSDERVYVENVVAMIDAGDYNHRFYTYPALFYYLLRAALAGLPEAQRHSADAYVLSRCVVATFGLLNVALLAFVAARWFDPVTGLVAALLAAVSPVDVFASHQVRPDVVMQSFGLMGIVAIDLVGRKLKCDALAGVAIGAASAIKFTGLLLVPSYVLARGWRAGPRVRGLVVAGLATVLVAVLCTPYAALNLREYQTGPPRQLQQYYPRAVTVALVRDHVLFFVRATRNALGSLGAMAAVLGAVLLLRQSTRRWLPLLVYPVITVCVMATGSLVFARYVLPSIDVLYVAAAFGIARSMAALRWQWMGAVLVALIAIPQVRESKAIAEPLAQPSAQDRALDWALAYVPAGSRILETRPAAALGASPGAMIGFPPERYEVLYSYTNEDGTGLLPLLERHVALVVVDPGFAWGELRTVYPALDAYGRPELLLKTVREPLAYSPVSLADGAAVTASSADGVAALTDGRLSSHWSTPGALQGSEWIQIDLARTMRIGRVEIVVPSVPGTYDPEIAIETSTDGGDRERVASIPLRPWLRDQHQAFGPLSQEFLIKPKPVRAIRILQLGSRPYPWAVSEIRLYERSSAAGG